MANIMTGLYDMFGDENGSPGQVTLKDLDKPPTSMKRTEKQKKTDLDAAGIIVGLVLKKSKDTLEVENYFDKIKVRYGLKKINYKNLGKPGTSIYIKLNPEKEIQVKGLEMRAKGKGEPPLKTMVNWKGQTLKAGSVTCTAGKQMLANPVGPDHQKGSEASENKTQDIFMQQLPQKGEMQGTGNQWYIKGHLLNAKLGGPAHDLNLFPITRSANSQHLSFFETPVKAYVEKGRGFCRYTVSISDVNIKGPIRIEGCREEKYTVYSKLNCTFDKIDQSGKPKNEEIPQGIISDFEGKVETVTSKEEVKESIGKSTGKKADVEPGKMDNIEEVRAWGADYKEVR
ncbi:MAG: hypothetical protein GY757_11530 [bacterium]|nr:hypothetical protein [bacterium]